MEGAKPKRAEVFVGSSSESLRIAQGVQENLESDANVRLWSQGIFKLSQSTLDGLLAAMRSCDYAVIVLNPEDSAMIRGGKMRVPRDNLVFELGLFLGHLGCERTFFIVPRGEEQLHLPTDLLGITPATYDVEFAKENPVAAVGSACGQIRRAMQRGIDYTRYYLRKYPDLVQQTVFSPMIANSPFVFEKIIESAESEVFPAAQNHYYILVQKAERSRARLFEFMREGGRVRFLICDPESSENVASWSKVTTSKYEEDLRKAIVELKRWVSDADREGLQLKDQKTPVVPVSMTFIDPEDERGGVFFAPNAYNAIAGGQRASF